MQVNSIKPFLKNSFPWILVAGCWGALHLGVYNNIKKYNKMEDEAKAYIQKNDSLKYNDLIAKDNYPNSFNWITEADKLKEDLRIDSIAKTNYALGMQAIRDSLANANKK